MSENYPTRAQTDPLSPEYPPVDYSSGQSEPQGTTGVAKDQAANVSQSAADAGQHVAGVAKGQAQNVVAEAGSQAKNLLGQAQSELTSHAGTQQQRLAQGLHSLADQLQSMAQGAEPGMVTDLARQGSSKSHEVGSWLESREPGHLLEEVQRFARRRPGAFLLGAAGAGLLAGRLTRGVKDAGSDSSSKESPDSDRFSAPTMSDPVYDEPSSVQPFEYDSPVTQPIEPIEPIEPYGTEPRATGGYSSGGGGL